METLVVVLAAWPHPFISIYTDIPTLRDASVASVWVMCFSYIVLIPSNIFFQSVSGTGKTKAAFLLEMQKMFSLCLRLPLKYAILNSDSANADFNS